MVLDGRVRVMGITPFTVDDLPYGRYGLNSGEPGYTALGDDLTLKPSSKLNVNVELRPKGRMGAMARSLILPGWGQTYSHRDGTASFYRISLGIGALIAGVASLDYALNRSDFDTAKENYTDAIIEGEDGESEWRTARLARRRLDRSQNILFYAGAGIGALWALNALDAAFNFPAFDPIPVGEQVSLRLQPRFDRGVGAKLELTRAIQ